MHTARISILAIVLFALSCAPEAKAPTPSALAPTAVARATVAPAWFVPDLALPVSASTLEPPAGIPVLILTRAELWFEGKVIAHVAAADPTKGFDGSEKVGGANGMLLLPLQAVLQGTKERLSPQGTFIVAADRRVAYRTLVELIFTAGLCLFSRPYLAVQSSLGEHAAIEIEVPRSTAQTILKVGNGDAMILIKDERVTVYDICDNCPSGEATETFALSNPIALQAKLARLRNHADHDAPVATATAAYEIPYATLIQVADIAIKAGFTRLRLGIIPK